MENTLVGKNSKSPNIAKCTKDIRGFGFGNPFRVPETKPLLAGFFQMSVSFLGIGWNRTPPPKKKMGGSSLLSFKATKHYQLQKKHDEPPISSVDLQVVRIGSYDPKGRSGSRLSGRGQKTPTWDLDPRETPLSNIPPREKKRRKQTSKGVGHFPWASFQNEKAGCHRMVISSTIFARRSFNAWE